MAHHRVGPPHEHGARDDRTDPHPRPFAQEPRYSDQEQRNPAREVPLPPRVNLPMAATSAIRSPRHPVRRGGAARAARPLSDQTDYLLAAHDYAMLACLLFSGVRRSELRRLRINDIDFQHGQHRVRGKGGTARTVSIPAVLLTILRAYLHDVRGDAGGQFLFLELASSRELGSSDGQPQWYTAGPDSQNRLLPPSLLCKIEAEDDDYGLGPHTPYQRAYLYGRLAGVDGPHGSHRWRHTHAAMCAEAGMTLEGIRRAPGARPGQAPEQPGLPAHHAHLHPGRRRLPARCRGAGAARPAAPPA